MRRYVKRLVQDVLRRRDLLLRLWEEAQGPGYYQIHLLLLRETVIKGRPFVVDYYHEFRTVFAASRKEARRWSDDLTSSQGGHVLAIDNVTRVYAFRDNYR